MACGLKPLSTATRACAVSVCTRGAQAMTREAKVFMSMPTSARRAGLYRRRQRGQPGGVVVVEPGVPGAELRLRRRCELGDGVACKAPPGACPQDAFDVDRDGAGVVA